MMAIEAEFGCIFTTEEERRLEEARNSSLWQPFYKSISEKKKHREFVEVMQQALKLKEDKQK